jgi:hypothetical protein
LPTVPYTPFSTAQPQSPGEGLSVNTPGAAFGENVGAALKQLGSTTEQAGSEIFQRAIALQDLKNENDARTAQTDFATKSSELHAQYGALTGQAAADALPKFLKDQADLRTSIRGSLNTPVAQRMYDADTLPFLQRNVFSASSHAAEENKKYTIETLGSSAKTAEEQAALHPDDENYVDQQRTKIKGLVTSQVMAAVGTSDPNDPNVVKAVNDALSKQRAEQILAKAVTDPITAGKWQQKYADQLTNPADRDRVNATIENRGAAVAASNIATSILQAHRQPDGSYDLPATQLEQLARDQATKALPDNPLVADTTVGKLHSLMSNQTYFTKYEQQDAKNEFNQILDKQDIHDVQTFLAMPGADKVMSKLPPDMRTAPQLQKYINNFQAGRDRQTNEYWSTTINGMRSSDSSAFMSIDPTDPQYHLSKQDIIRVQNQQAELARNPQDDPRVSRAMSWLLGARGAELKELEVDQKHPGSEDDYYHFRGALQEAIQVYQEDHKGQQPTYEDIVDKIGPQIIKTHAATPGWFGTNFRAGEEPAFRQFNRPTLQDIPQEERDKITQDFINKGVPQPTESELTQIYARQLFNKFYKQSKPSE